MNMYNGYHYMGMHAIWWVVWIIFLIWIFATPYDVPGRPKRKDSALDILQKRYASGSISLAEYNDKKKNIESDLVK